MHLCCLVDSVRVPGLCMLQSCWIRIFLIKAAVGWLWHGLLQLKVLLSILHQGAAGSCSLLNGLCSITIDML